MEQKIYYGQISPSDFAQNLVGYFHRGNYQVQQVGQGEKLVVQVSTSTLARSGGQTAISISMQMIEDGVMVSVGKQEWLGIAASLGTTVLSALANPLSLLGRLDDLAQDVESLKLTEEIWRVIDSCARTRGASQQLSEKLRRMECEFCGTANKVGDSRCIACGAPLGGSQPIPCPNCGFLLQNNERNCPNCGKIR